MKINRDINYAKERQTTEITSYYVNYEKNDGNQINGQKIIWQILQKIQI